MDGKDKRSAIISSQELKYNIHEGEIKVEYVLKRIG